jgi:hypothetical protein
MLFILAFNNAVGQDITNELKSDIEKVWPLVEIVKAEYNITTNKLNQIEDKAEKNAYLDSYEVYVKKKYFEQILELNIRQGKLLLLLIHRELGETPYQLLKTYLSRQRARFWQAIASLLGTDLKKEYSKTKYPEIEKELTNFVTQATYFQTECIHH